MNQRQKLNECSSMNTKDPRCHNCPNRVVIKDLAALNNCEYLVIV